MYESQDGFSTADAFSTKDLWASSIFSVDPLEDARDEFNAFGLDSTDFSLLERLPQLKTPALTIPNIESIDHNELEDISTTESVAALELESLQLEQQQQDEVVEDIWMQQRETQTGQPGVRNWESFYHQDYREPKPYLSEARPLVFSALLQTTSNSDLTIVDTEPFLKALFLLGLGRESYFFHIDEKTRHFKSAVKDLVIPGTSIETIRSVIGVFREMGEKMRWLQSFVEKTFQSSRSTRCKIALAETVKSVLEALQMHATETFGDSRSLLQLQHDFKKPASIVAYVVEVVMATQHLRTQEELLSQLFHLIEQREFNDPWLQPLILEILSRVSIPWLEILGISIGLQHSLQPTDRTASNLLEQSNDFAEQEIGIDQVITLPSFMVGEERELVLLTCASLQLLRKHEPSHVLALSNSSATTCELNLKWCFDWRDIEKVQQHSEDYTDRIKVALKEMLNCTALPLGGDISEDGFVNSSKTMESNVEMLYPSLEVLDCSPLNVMGDSNPVGRSVRDVLVASLVSIGEERPFPPPLSLSSTLSFTPIISAQSRLLNHACLRMIFIKHQLPRHLLLQHSFQLLGSGLFSTRLSNSLFSSDLSSAERQKGHARSGKLGLRLTVRETWPPASSELQLALAGILSDSYHEDIDLYSTTSISTGPAPDFGDTLPGDLSFAIRNLPEPEIEACLDPNSIHALDFLRLQYRPPPPLDSVISSSSLEKYDQVFKFLLRLLRLLFVTKQISGRSISRHNRSRVKDVGAKFRIEATHFVRTLAEYFFDVAIATTWQKFWVKVKDLEQRLEAEDGVDLIGKSESVFELRRVHDSVLDDMLFGLLLRRRQKAVADLLEDIFSLVLAFAIEDEKEVEVVDVDQKIQALYKEFKTKVGVFVAVCQGLSEKTGYAGESSIEQLIPRLDMTGWYDRTSSG